MMPTDRQFGSLRAKDYAQLLRKARESRVSRFEFEQEAKREAGKLSKLLSEHGLYWWVFYDFPLPAHLALLCHLLGWTETLKEVSKRENPHRAFIDFADEEDARTDNPVDEMTPDQQALFINLLLGVFYSLESLGYYSLSINELLEKRSVEALRDALSVDRMVIATDTGAKIIAMAQLRRERKTLSGLMSRIKGPHNGRRQYVDLRLMQRVFEDACVIATCRQDEVLSLAESLDLYVGQRGDPVKGLSGLFRKWKKEATT